MASSICGLLVLLLAYSSYFIHIDPHCAADPQTELSNYLEKSRHGQQ